MSMIFHKYTEEFANVKLNVFTVKRVRGVKLKTILIIKIHRLKIRMKTQIRMTLMKLLQAFMLGIKGKKQIKNFK
jgi:hypothetical protein